MPPSAMRRADKIKKISPRKGAFPILAKRGRKRSAAAQPRGAGCAPPRAESRAAGKGFAPAPSPPPNKKAHRPPQASAEQANPERGRDRASEDSPERGRGKRGARGERGRGKTTRRRRGACHSLKACFFDILCAVRFFLACCRARLLCAFLAPLALFRFQA